MHRIAPGCPRESGASETASRHYLQDGLIGILLGVARLRARFGLRKVHPDVIDQPPPIRLVIVDLPGRHGAPGQAFTDAPEIVGVGIGGVLQRAIVAVAKIGRQRQQPLPIDAVSSPGVAVTYPAFADEDVLARVQILDRLLQWIGQPRIRSRGIAFVRVAFNRPREEPAGHSG